MSFTYTLQTIWHHHANVNRLPALLLLFALAACAPLPPGPVTNALWRASPNFDQRRPNYVILHQTTNSTAEQALATLTNPERKVSAHYLIGREGTLFQLVTDSARAWHAGESWWGGVTDINSASIGIELDNTGEEEFAEPQIIALLTLLEDLRSRYRIPSENILAHGDIAPTRKVDPSRLFPWRRLAQHGFGLWCETPQPKPPAGFDPVIGLLALGYDTVSPAATRQAFRRHFLNSDADDELTIEDQALLYCLIQKKGQHNGALPF